MRPSRRILLVLALACGLAGCQRRELYTGLSEREANEMVAVLRGADIDAAKSSKDDKTWTLEAPDGAFAPAIDLLRARGYPREHFSSLGEVFRKQGLVSTPVEEHARLAYGLSQEMADTISQIDGVISARVHLSLPADEAFSEVKTPASASVFVKYDPNVDLSSQVGPIKALIVNGVEGLPYDRVSVVLSPARVPVPPPRTSIAAPHIILASVLAALGGGMCLALFLTSAWRARRPNRVITLDVT